MRYTAFFSCVLLYSTITTVAFAQQADTNDQSAVRFGLGTGLFYQTAGEAIITGTLPTQSSIDVIPATAISFFVPIEIPSVKIEPEIGMYNYSFTSSDLGQTQDFTATSFRLGIGLFYDHTSTSNFHIYAGGRVGIITHNSQSNTSTAGGPPSSVETTASRTDLFVGPAVGGEYFFSSHFSLGVETELEYLSMGTETPNSTPPLGDSTTTSGHTLVTKAGIVARVYF